jgi:hypothetical protein
MCRETIAIPRLIKLSAGLLALSFVSFGATAQSTTPAPPPAVRVQPEATNSADDATELAKKLQDPIGDSYSFPSKNSASFNISPDNGAQDVLNIRLVTPTTVATSPLLAAAAQTPSSDANEPVTDATPQAPSLAELARLKQNPVSGLRQVVLQANVNPNMPGSGRTQGIYSVQPVFPFRINADYRLITYTILPVYNVPGLSGEKSATGLGDTLVNLFVSPIKPGALVWGAGPSILLPTRTDATLGSNRVALGPAVLLFYPSEPWSAGVVLQNGWSLGGSGFNRVNAFGAQYLFNYNLPDAWYINSNATITSDWTIRSGKRWTVPIGGGVGKIFTIGQQPVSLSLQAFDNVVTPRGGPKWSVSFQFAFLFAAPAQ